MKAIGIAIGGAILALAAGGLLLFGMMLWLWFWGAYLAFDRGIVLLVTVAAAIAVAGAVVALQIACETNSDSPRG